MSPIWPPHYRFFCSIFQFFSFNFFTNSFRQTNPAYETNAATNKVTWTAKGEIKLPFNQQEQANCSGVETWKCTSSDLIRRLRPKPNPTLAVIRKAVKKGQATPTRRLTQPRAPTGFFSVQKLIPTEPTTEISHAAKIVTSPVAPAEPDKAQFQSWPNPIDSAAAFGAAAETGYVPGKRKREQCTWLEAALLDEWKIQETSQKGELHTHLAEDGANYKGEKHKNIPDQANDRIRKNGENQTGSPCAL